MTTPIDQIASLENQLKALPAQIEAAARSDSDEMLGKLLADQHRAEIRLPVLRRQLAESAHEARRIAAIAARKARVDAHDTEGKTAGIRAKAADKVLASAMDALDVLTNAMGRTPVSPDYVKQELSAKAAADRQRAALAGEAVEADAEAHAFSEARQAARWAIGVDTPSDARLRASTRHIRIDANASDLDILDALRLSPTDHARVEYLILVEGWALLDREPLVEAA